MPDGNRAAVSHLVFAQRLEKNPDAQTYMDRALEHLYNKIDQRDANLNRKLLKVPAETRHITFVGGSLAISPDLDKELSVFREVASKTPMIHGDIGRLAFFRQGNIIVFEFDPATAKDLEAMGTMTSELLDRKKGFSDYRPSVRYHITALHVEEPINSKANYWLCAILLKDKTARDEFLQYTNDNGVMTRPAWRLMNKLVMFKNSMCDNLDNAQQLEDRLVNIPSSVRIN